MLDRGTLSMEPFVRNASYIALDMSHPSITPEMVKSLISRMFKMIEAGDISPISPVLQFSFNEISAAIRLLRSGAHMGKIIISDGNSSEVLQVQARSTSSPLRLRDDASYLIIGGLKGLCGSLAVFMARRGARYISVMSRSGYEDEKSQSMIHHLNALGTTIHLVQGDVANLEDVRRAYRGAPKPVAGVI